MINNRGYDVISEEEYYDNIMEELKKQFPNMSESPSNLMVIIARLIARNENRRDYDRVKAYSEAYVATATGMHLSKAVAIAGISRLNGTRAVGKIRVTREPDIPQVIIPSHTVIVSNDLKYQTINNNAIIMNEKTLELEIESIDVGDKYNISNGSKFDTLLNIRGIKEIRATTDIEGGTNTESDKDLRERYYARVSSHSNSSLKGIIDAVKRVNGVYLVDGVENWTDKEKDGLPPHSFVIYVGGATDKEIGEAIMSSKPAGVQPHGKKNVEVEFLGRKYNVKFSRFENVEVHYDIEVVVDKSISSPDFVENLKEILVAYTNRNTKITSYELSNYISQEMAEVRGVKKLSFGFTENPDKQDELVAPKGKNFDCRKENIKVRVV